MTLRPTTATISHDSARAETWKRIFGGDTIPIKGPVPTVASVGDLGLREVYLLDLAAISPEQMDRLVAHCAEGGDLAVVRRLIEEHAFPILADDVTVVFDARLVL